MRLQQGLDLGEELLDRIEIGRGKVTQFGAGAFDERFRVVGVFNELKWAMTPKLFKKAWTEVTRVSSNTIRITGASSLTCLQNF